MADSLSDNETWQGVLDKDALKRIDLAFNVFDKDDSGSINVRELRAIFEMMGVEVTYEAVYRMIA